MKMSQNAQLDNFNVIKKIYLRIWQTKDVLFLKNLLELITSNLAGKKGGKLEEKLLTYFLMHLLLLQNLKGVYNYFLPRLTQFVNLFLFLLQIIF